MISHHHKCIFIHIPKTAGQSIEHVFVNLLNLTWETRAPLLLRLNDNPKLGPRRLAHLKAEEYVRHKYVPQAMFNQYFKFAFVRNPWSRMVSYYKYSGFNKKTAFKPFLMGVFKNKIFGSSSFVAPQSTYIYTNNDKQLVDFVGRFENLQNDFNYVCEQIGLPATPVPHINSSAYENIPIFSLEPKKFARNILRRINLKNIPDYKTYQEYYDQESIDLVAQLYKEDIERFDYAFE